MTKENFLKILEHVKKAVEDDFVSPDDAMARLNELYASTEDFTPAQIERAAGRVWMK